MEQLQTILDSFNNPNLKVVESLDDSKKYVSMYVKYKWPIVIREGNNIQHTCYLIQQQVPVDLSTTTCDVQCYKCSTFVDPNTFAPIFIIELIFNFPRS